MTPVPAPGGRDYVRTRVTGIASACRSSSVAWSLNYLLPDVARPGQGLRPPESPLAGGPDNAVDVFGQTRTLTGMLTTR